MLVLMKTTAKKKDKGHLRMDVSADLLQDFDVYWRGSIFKSRTEAIAEAMKEAIARAGRGTKRAARS